MCHKVIIVSLGFLPYSSPPLRLMRQSIATLPQLFGILSSQLSGEECFYPTRENRVKIIIIILFSKMHNLRISVLKQAN